MVSALNAWPDFPKAYNSQPRLLIKSQPFLKRGKPLAHNLKQPLS